MSNLPNGWSQVTVQVVAEVNPRKWVDLGGEDLVTFVPMASVSEDSGTIERPLVRRLVEVNKGFTQFAEGDVILAKITPSMENGKAAVARGLVNGIGYGSTEFHVLRTYGAVLPEYLWRFLRQQEFRDNAKRVMSGAVGQQRVPAEYVRSQPIPLPPLAEQERITSRIDSLTDRTSNARSELREVSNLIATYRNNLLIRAFSGNLARVKEERKAQTQNWPRIRLRDLVSKVVAGKNMRCDERPPHAEENGVVKVSAVTWGEFDPHEAKTLPASFIPGEQTRIARGDFLISRANTLELLAAVVIVGDTPSNLFLSDKILKLEMPDEDKPWVLWFLRSRLGRKAIESRATGSQSSMRNLSQRNLLDIEIPWPSRDERSNIVEKIQDAFESLTHAGGHCVATAKLLLELENAILKRAFRGELASQSPSDEPASILLNRIEAARTTQLQERRRAPVRHHSHRGPQMMLNKTMKEVLTEANGWLPAQVAFQNCGVGDGATTEDIELLYGELRELFLNGELEVEPELDGNDRKLFDRIRLRAI